MKDLVNDVLHDYSKHPVHARTKRRLVAAVGWVSHKLFENSDVQDLCVNYNHVVSIASANRRVINMNSKKVASLHLNVNDLL